MAGRRYRCRWPAGPSRRSPAPARRSGGAARQPGQAGGADERRPPGAGRIRPAEGPDTAQL